jgi:hypothetical protein
VPTDPPEIKPENQEKIKPQHGGRRPGAGRKPKPRPEQAPAGPAALIPPPPPEPPVHPRRAELAATAAAANAGWAIPEVGRQKAVYECLAILADRDAGGRLKMTAVKTLAAIERLNQTLAAKPTAASPIGPDVEALIDRVYAEQPAADATAAGSTPVPD